MRMLDVFGLPAGGGCLLLMLTLYYQCGILSTYIRQPAG